MLTPLPFAPLPPQVEAYLQYLERRERLRKEQEAVLRRAPGQQQHLSPTDFESLRSMRPEQVMQRWSSLSNGVQAQLAGGRSLARA